MDLRTTTNYGLTINREEKLNYYKAMSTEREIFRDIEDELFKAREEHGENNEGISFNTWLAILGEEYGEACQAILHSQMHNENFCEDVHKVMDDARKELIQVAAVSILIIQEIDSGV